MKRYVIATSLLLCGAHAGADSAAVRELNFELGLRSGDTYADSSRDSNFYGLSGRGNFSLGGNLGGALVVGTARTRRGDAFRDSVGELTPQSQLPSCETANNDGLAYLFMREPTVGRVGLGYGVGRIRSKCDGTFLATGTNSLDTQTYTVNAEYYFARVTLEGVRSQTQFDGTAPDFESARFALRGYPTDNLRLGLSADGLDLKGTYGVDLEYQPPLFDDSVSLFLGYATQDQTLRTHSITLGFSYYFDTRVRLLARDREYR